MISKFRRRKVALSLLSVIVLECLLPPVTVALTSGPAQPEFSSFEPISSSGMVNEFSGEFTYNLPIISIPGAQGGGYAMSLSYHNGVTAEQDASWVGLGWTLNPGSISRQANGFPDDFKGNEVTYYNKTWKNQTMSVLSNFGLEIGSKDENEWISSGVGIGIEYGVRHNTFRGWSTIQGFNASAFGLANMSIGVDDGMSHFNASISPIQVLYQAAGRPSFGIEEDNKQMQAILSNSISKLERDVTSYVSRTLGVAKFPQPGPAMHGEQFSLRVGATFDPIPLVPILSGVRAGLSGSYSWQEGIPEQVEQAYGLLYTGYAGADEGVMDYYVDKESYFEEKDKYLGIPHANVDNFRLMGEGLSGTIRAFNRSIGHFRPRQKKSYINSYDGGLDLAFGSKGGIGGAVSAGYTKTEIKGPQSFANLPDQEFEHGFKTDKLIDGNVVDHRGTYLAFDGDQGGTLLASNSDEPIYAPVSTGWQMNLSSSDVKELANDGKRPGNSSSVEFCTNAEMLEVTPTSSVAVNARTKRADILHGFVDRSDEEISDAIGEVSVLNSHGLRYVYGLPVYSRNEEKLSFSPTKSDARDRVSYNGRKRVNKGLVKEDSESYYSGQNQHTPYASQFLLTDITTSNYVDVNYDGPTPDDFGGYTRFEYRQTAGTWNKSSDSAMQWYKWRLPYVGFSVSNGKLLDGFDDRLSVSFGQREQYYLGAVRTKTHVAYFITNKTDTIVDGNQGSIVIRGSQQERLDAYEAFRFDSDDKVNEKESASGKNRFYPSGDWDPSLAGRKVQTDGPNASYEIDDQSDVEPVKNKQEYLERIVLYSLDSDGKPDRLIKTVHFEYDYSLMAWNKENPRYIIRDTASDGSVEVIPTYNNPSHLNSATYFNTEGLFDEHADSVAVARKLGKLTLKRVWFEHNGVVNATIAPYDFSYRYARKADFSSNVQEKYNGILSELEEGDLSSQTDWNNPQNPHFVSENTDRWGYYRKNGAHLLRKYFPYTEQNIEESLSAAPWTLKKITLPSGGEIHIQYEDHDYSFVQDQRAMAMVGIKDFDGRNFYLRFDDYLGELTTEEKNWLVDEMKNQFVENGEKMYFRFLYNFTCADRDDILELFAEPPKTGVDYVYGYVDVKSISINSEGEIYVETHGDVTFGDLAKEYENATVYGLDCGEHYVGYGGTEDKSLVDRAVEVLEYMPLVGTGMIVGREWSNPPPTFDQFSYVRIPVTKAKRGGGHRVKRVLMYDKGLESGDAVLYGTEYDYTTERTIGGKTYSISSGVATNEPAIGREENSLVKFQPRRGNPTFLEAVISGTKLEQYEGPLFEGQLPGPSVGYSKVVSKNIHNGITGTGFTVVEYNTVKDFPLLYDWTGLHKKEENSIPIASSLMGFMKSLHAGSQGYAFVQQNLHGTVKRVAAYGGSYHDPSSHYLVASTEHEYATPQEDEVKIFSGIGESLTSGWPGKTIEVIQESKYQLDKHQNHIGSWDGGIVLPPLVFLPLPFASISYRMVNESRALNTHVNVKNISYPPIVTQTRQYKEGIWHTTKYLVFDEATGQPVVTRSHDGYHQLSPMQTSGSHEGWYTNYHIPGYTEYEALGQAVENVKMEYLNSTISNIGGGIYSLANSSVDFKLFPGDLLRIFDQSTETTELAHVVEVVSSTQVKIVAAGIVSSLSATGSDIDAKVVESGRTNQLTMRVGSVVTYGELESDVLSNSVLGTPNLDTIVIGASALTLSDDWTYDGASYVPNVNANVYESGQRGNWRAHRSYTYMADRKSAHASSTDRTYTRAGAYSTFDPFNWQGSQTSEWLKTTTIVEYSPHGEVLEERNALSIPSSARFYHQNMVPSIIAGNAHKQDIFFESFEESATTSTPADAHTGVGYQSLNGRTSSNPIEIGSINISSRMNASGVMIRFWFKGQGTEPPHILLNSTNIQPDSLAHCGEWKLYEAIVDSPSVGATAVKFYYDGGPNGAIDDVRIQPFDSETTCYVYDRTTLRLIAQFDDQHFALLYQYNGEGKLVRTLKETERGVKTLRETQYHIPLVARSESTTPPISGLINIYGEGSSKKFQRLGETVTSPWMSGNGRNANGTTELLKLHASPNGASMQILQQPEARDSSQNESK